MTAKLRLLLTAFFLVSVCSAQDDAAVDRFEVEAERFADLRLLRYQVPGFDELELSTKRLLYDLYEAENGESGGSAKAATASSTEGKKASEAAEAKEGAS